MPHACGRRLVTGTFSHGLKSRRWLRLADNTTPQERLSGPLELQVFWPRGGKAVYAHAVNTRVRKRYSCQFVIVRQSLWAHFWTSVGLETRMEMLLAHLAARWDIEVLFVDSKEEPGLVGKCSSSGALLSVGHTDLHLSGTRPHCLRIAWQRPVTIGAVWREIQSRHGHRVRAWRHEPFFAGVHPVRTSGGCVQKLKERASFSKRHFLRKRRMYGNKECTCLASLVSGQLW
ncbi:MAG TPA: hypothetical protein VGF67_00270 [Ktedonobacteraceae bacterium]|jgi:hypothetical protein